MRSCNFIVKSGFSTRPRWLFRIIFVNIIPINYLFSTLCFLFLESLDLLFPFKPGLLPFSPFLKETDTYRTFESVF